MTLDFGRFEALTFDCYGTLIDWEVGIMAATRQLLGERAAGIDDEAILEAFARHERHLEHGPYQPYRAILSQVAQAMAAEHGQVPSGAAVLEFAARSASPLFA